MKCGLFELRTPLSTGCGDVACSCKVMCVQRVSINIPSTGFVVYRTEMGACTAWGKPQIVAPPSEFPAKDLEDVVLREARLRPEYADLYPMLVAGAWHAAAVTAEKV